MVFVGKVLVRVGWVLAAIVCAPLILLMILWALWEDCVKPYLWGQW